jgi:Fur family peroxide stress response transcriptional regulator
MKEQVRKALKNNNENMIDKFIKSCRKNGLRVTPQRIAVYKALKDSKEHPSAEMVWGQVRRMYPGISLDTVNRTLLTLSERGLAFIVEGSGNVRRYDGDLDNHQHIRCIKCGKVFDFHYEPYDDIKVPESITAKFEILRKTVYFEGICASCRGKSGH